MCWTRNEFPKEGERAGRVNKVSAECARNLPEEGERAVCAIEFPEKGECAGRAITPLEVEMRGTRNGRPC